ncbi:IS701 family transposase [Streptomonospora salina]|uniref:SRSO17 transposase n=1 Tax=Streptomonospora salina TaxID=104205 RepID=A0A841E5T5_9ACTN|nr:transposase [Streptomonospora salina]MBB5996548.1 SRSO17 transposase [Streptomonospora salina]
MDPAAVDELREDLDAFCAEVFASIPRRDTRAWGHRYLRGLMLDGRRKPIQPMAGRLPDGGMQTLQRFVGQSPWDPAPVQRGIATKVSRAISPAARIVDDTTVPKAGSQSAGAAHQWCGALGSRPCARTSPACTRSPTLPRSRSLSWRLFLPESWADAADERRAKTGVPEHAGHREKWRLALDMIDQARSWGLWSRRWWAVTRAMATTTASAPGWPGAAWTTWWRCAVTSAPMPAMRCPRRRNAPEAGGRRRCRATAPRPGR